METIEQLIEDYYKRIKAAKELKQSIPKHEVQAHIRLTTKESCYRTFIVELERIKGKSKQ